MYDTSFHDTPTDEEMLALMSSMNDGEWTTNALGQAIVIPSDHYWRQDVIKCDQQLKRMGAMGGLLNSQRLIQPDAFGSDIVMLASDPLLETLTTLYTVLVTLFHETEIGQHYRPSPYATRFLWAFGSCAYLREAGFHQPPTMSREMAEQTVMELNQRLSAWYQRLKQPDFTYECNRNRRNSRNNYQSLCKLIAALFDRYSRLQVIRVDLSYTAIDSPNIDYETARYHREQLCETFHKHALFHQLIGFAWKLEWQPKKGFHYHFIFFFDGHQCREDITQARLIGEMWANAMTGGQGHYYNCNLDAEQRYCDNAMGCIDYHDFEKKRGLYWLAKYLTKIDEYAAMLVKGRTFQTSRKPILPEGRRMGRPRQTATAWPDVEVGL
jgi:hypothetical protein